MPVAEPGFYTYMGCGIEVESDPNVVREGLFLTPLPTPRRSIPACDQILTVVQHVVGDGADIMVSLARFQYEIVGAMYPPQQPLDEHVFKVLVRED